MRKKISIILLFVVNTYFLFNLISCTNNDEIVIKKSEYDKLVGTPKPEYPKLLATPNYALENYSLRGLQVIVIDGCEYLLGSTGSYHGGIVLAHKGNCKFCEKRRLNEYKLYLR